MSRVAEQEVTGKRPDSLLQRLSDWLFPAKAAPPPQRASSVDASVAFDVDDAASECSVATTASRRRRGKAGPAAGLRRRASEARRRTKVPLEPPSPRSTWSTLEPLREEEDDRKPRRRRLQQAASCAELAASLRSAVNARKWLAADRLLRLDALLVEVDAPSLAASNLGRATARLSRDRRVPDHVRAAAAQAVAHWRDVVQSHKPAFGVGDAVLFYADPTKRGRHHCLDATVVDVCRLDKTTFRYVLSIEDADPADSVEVDDAHLEPKPPDELASL